MAKVFCDVDYVMVEANDGRQQPGVRVSCSRCGAQEESFGTTERSIRRCMMLLKEGCQDGTDNYYAAADAKEQRSYTKLDIAQPSYSGNDISAPTSRRSDPAVRITDQTPFAQLDLLLLKCHTTGLSKAKAELVQVCTVDVRRGLIGTRSITNFCPTIEVPERATQVHGLSNEVLAGALPVAEVAPDLTRTFHEAAARGAVLFGWGISRFDIPILKRFVTLPGMPVLDLAVVEKRLYPDEHSHGIADVLERWNIGADTRGDGTNYLRAVWQLYVSMLTGGLDRMHVLTYLGHTTENHDDDG